MVAAWRRASCSVLSGSKAEGGDCVVMRRYVPVAKRNLCKKTKLGIRLTAGIITIKEGMEIINNQKLIYSIYAFIKSVYGNKRGRKYKVSLIYQIVITIFKLRYNLPDRVLEGLLKIDHVTISRIIQRISLYIGNIKLPRDNKNELNIEYYVVDTTTIRIGKSKNKKTYSGYKNYHGVKYQLICDSENKIKEISRGYEASIHDKKVFIKEYEEI